MKKLLLISVVFFWLPVQHKIKGNYKRDLFLIIQTKVKSFLIRRKTPLPLGVTRKLFTSSRFTRFKVTNASTVAMT